MGILTSSIDSVVDPPELRHGALEQRLDLLGAGDVCFDGDGGRFAFAGDLGDELLGSGEACLVAVGEDELCAAFAGEGDGGCLADACGVEVRVGLTGGGVGGKEELTGGCACDEGDAWVEGHFVGCEVGVVVGELIRWARMLRGWSRGGEMFFYRIDRSEYSQNR